MQFFSNGLTRSTAMVNASITVGTPSASTGTPILSLLIPTLWFPTPEPGLIPLSDNCIVVFSLDIFLAARASMAITADGFTCFAMPLIISAVSSPVSAMTPGITAHILPSLP